MGLWSRVYRTIWRLLHRRRFGVPSDMNLERRYRKYDIGSYTYGAPTVMDWNEGTTLKVGRYCSIAGGVTIMLGGEHRTDLVTTYPFYKLFARARDRAGAPVPKGDVVIGNDVWISTESMILAGVRIGDGAVVGARSLVTRDVPPYAVVAGQPAEVKRFRFGDREIEALLKIAWWEWPANRVEEAWPLLLSSNIAGFVERYGNGAGAS